MPRRTDIESILIVGAGPIVIGQACEFDYSGTQACKALAAEGYRVVLVNSNPATIMTDPDLADATYVEPITPDIVARIIERERPQAVLSTMGGQTALNVCAALAERGVLEAFDVELIGASLETIRRAEDRDLFRQAMRRAGLACARARMVDGLEPARAALEETGLPSIIRPSFTLGGSGGGIAYNREEFDRIVTVGLDTSPAGTVLVEESLLGWKEFEMEVVRDRADNCIIVCSIENVDPMGIHTGDSITVAPALTLTDKEYQVMRNAALRVLREIGVETGGANVQFAIEPARRAPGRHRDEPAGLALLGAGLQGDGLPHRQGRGAAGGGLHARRARQRHHRRHPGVVRAHHRLRRHQDPALCLREVPGYRGAADDLDEVGGRGDGDRAQLRRIAAEGPALHGDRPRGARRGGCRGRRRGGAGLARVAARPARPADAGPPPAGGRGAAPRS